MIVNNGAHILVSVIVCCYNEEKYIKRCINSLLQQQNLAGEMEILVVDGMSNDNTPAILNEIAQSDVRVKLFNNILKVKPPAVNIGFRASRGKYIAICDAHTTYEPNYISNSLKIFESHPETWCVGGPIESIGESNFGKANAIAMSSPIGVGNAKHRFPKYEGYAEMVCFPIFLREVLEKVGYYDEFFIINHDDEYCFRLRKAGGKVYLSPTAKSYYYVRNTFIGLFKQYYSYGLWQIAFLKKHKIPISLRQLVPFTFFFFVIVLFIIGIVINQLFIGVLLPSLYLTILLLFSFPILLNYGVKIALNFPLAVFTLHFSYAIGFTSGIYKFLIKNSK